MGRFVSAFGAASVEPDSVGPGWPELDWVGLGERCAADPRALKRLVPTEQARDAKAWAAMTRQAQADLVKTTIELLRRLKYAPTGGFIHHTLADPGGSGGFGVLDHDRRPKPAWQALIDACRPVIVVADPLPSELRAGQRLTVAVHVVSDLRHELSDAVIEARLTDEGGADLSTRRWAGTILADSCQLIGHTELVAPSRPGPIALVLELQAAGREITNRYPTRVI